MPKSNEGDDRALLSFEEQHGHAAEIALVDELTPKARELALIIEVKIGKARDRKSDKEFDAHTESCSWGEATGGDEEDEELEFQICCAELHDGRMDTGPYSTDQAVTIFGELVVQMVLLKTESSRAMFSQEGGWCQYDHPEVGRKHKKIFVVTIYDI